MKTNPNADGHNRNHPDAVLRQRVEERAYHIWLDHGCGHGNHEHHWFQAEREVMEAAQLEQRSGTKEKKRIGKLH